MCVNIVTISVVMIAMQREEKMSFPNELYRSEIGKKISFCFDRADIEVVYSIKNKSEDSVVTTMM